MIIAANTDNHIITSGSMMIIKIMTIGIIVSAVGIAGGQQQMTGGQFGAGENVLLPKLLCQGVPGRRLSLVRFAA